MVPVSAAVDRVLIVEENAAFGGVVKKAAELVSGLPVDLAGSYAEAAKLLNAAKGRYRVGVVDLLLADATNGEAVDLLLEHDVAALVLTSTLDPAMRDRIVAKPVTDYVLKQHPGAIDAVQRAIRRVLKNQERKVLLMHAPGAFRDFVESFLAAQRVAVVATTDADEAIEHIRRDEQISLVIVDHSPELDGLAFTALVRARFSQDRLAVLGVSESDDAFLGVQFLKSGANDVIRKPFLVEEFLSRANNCLDYMESIQTIREQANRDYLTGLYNRRYFYEIGKTLFSAARRGQVRLAAAMIDIDHFKDINDRYGHDVGDRVIVAVAETLINSFRGSDVVARMGGEEFCVLAVNSDEPGIAFERLRQRVEALDLKSDSGERIPVTVSLGVSNVLGQTVGELVSHADQMLYEAKRSGRNRVVTAQ